MFEMELYSERRQKQDIIFLKYIESRVQKNKHPRQKTREHEKHLREKLRLQQLEKLQRLANFNQRENFTTDDNLITILEKEMSSRKCREECKVRKSLLGFKNSRKQDSTEAVVNMVCKAYNLHDISSQLRINRLIEKISEKKTEKQEQNLIGHYKWNSDTTNKSEFLNVSSREKSVIKEPKQESNISARSGNSEKINKLHSTKMSRNCINSCKELTKSRPNSCCCSQPRLEHHNKFGTSNETFAVEKSS